jgi:hypothetical protein
VADLVLYAIIALFVAWELVAHFVYKNVFGHTLSNRILWLEERGGVPVRILIAGLVLALGIHLQGVF